MTSALQLHEQAMTIAKDLKAKYIDLFQVLLEIETRKVYQQFEVVSLHAYCVQILELSDNIANDFVQVVRKAITVPKLADAVITKQVSISKARKICPVITVKSADEWIAVATENTCRVIEKAVATANPRAAIYETMRYVSADTLEFKLAVSEEWEAALKETKDLLSQKHSRAVSSEEALLIVMKSFCEAESPVRKAERAQARREKTTARPDSARSPSRSALDNGGAPADTRTRYRPAKVEHVVDLRDQGQCVHKMPNGSRCTQKRWLQKHHVIGFTDGGKHTPSNLETLCYVHHKLRHSRGAGRDAPAFVT